VIDQDFTELWSNIHCHIFMADGVYTCTYQERQIIHKYEHTHLTERKEA